MKKLLFSLTLLAAGFTAAEAQSMLRVRLTTNSQINVSVDGRFFTKRGTSVTVGDLPYGRHRLKVYTLRPTRRGRMYQDLLFEGTVKTYEGMITMFVFDPNNGERDISEQDMGSFYHNHPEENKGYDDKYSQNKNNNNYRDNTANSNNEISSNSNDDNSSAPVATPVSADKLGTFTDSKMNKLKSKVSAKSNDTEKMKILMEALKNERLTTNQVGDIMDWLLFENSKVDFVKWAYTITVDNEYYSDLESKFAYKNSQDELNKFIKSKK